MQVTKATAHKKVCPFAHGFNHGQRTCLADGCMAWEWADPEYEYYHGQVATMYRGAAYSMTAHWPEGSLPLGSDWEWESVLVVSPSVSTSGWWRRPKSNRLGQCGRTLVREVD